MAEAGWPAEEASGCAVIWTSPTGAPDGSVSVPARCALLLWDCGVALELTAGTKKAASKESIASSFFMVPPLPHARELEGWPVQRGLHGLQTSPVSWLGEKELWVEATSCRAKARRLHGPKSSLAAFP